ncbi:MAG: hypothetical protein HRT45_04880 [Bdellovibrionales bacterium]|nr:hypothetical protein [Bdellovibrionales bacterium]
MSAETYFSQVACRVLMTLVMLTIPQKPFGLLDFKVFWSCSLLSVLIFLIGPQASAGRRLCDFELNRRGVGYELMINSQGQIVLGVGGETYFLASKHLFFRIFRELIQEPYRRISFEEATALQGPDRFDRYFEVDQPQQEMTNSARVYLSGLPSSLTEPGGVFERRFFRVTADGLSYNPDQISMNYLKQLPDTFVGFDGQFVVSAKHGFAFFNGQRLEFKKQSYFDFIELMVKSNGRVVAYATVIDAIAASSKASAHVAISSIRSRFREIDPQYDFVSAAGNAGLGIKILPPALMGCGSECHLYRDANLEAETEGFYDRIIVDTERFSVYFRGEHIWVKAKSYLKLLDYWLERPHLVLNLEQIQAVMGASSPLTAKQALVNIRSKFRAIDPDFNIFPSLRDGTTRYALAVSSPEGAEGSQAADEVPAELEQLE